MDRKSTDKKRSSAKACGNYANSVCFKPGEKSYPPEWKDTCREIYRAYQRHLTLEYGTKVKWQRIRNLVMREFDGYCDGKLVAPDENLNRQDLEHWAGPQARQINDVKFSFLDRYLRLALLLPHSGFSEATNRVIDYHEAETKRRLSEVVRGALYSPLAEDDKMSKEICGYSFQSQSNGSHDTSSNVVLYIQNGSLSQGFGVITWISSDRHFNADAVVREGVRRHGYWLPTIICNPQTGSRRMCGALVMLDRTMEIADGLAFQSANLLIAPRHFEFLECKAPGSLDTLIAQRDVDEHFSGAEELFFRPANFYRRVELNGDLLNSIKLLKDGALL